MKNTKETTLSPEHIVAAVVVLVVVLFLILWPKLYEPIAEKNREANFEEYKKSCVASFSDDELRAEWMRAKADLEKWEKEREAQRVKNEMEQAERERLRAAQCADIAYKTRHPNQCDTPMRLYYDDNRGYDAYRRTAENIYESNLLSICRERNTVNK